MLKKLDDQSGFLSLKNIGKKILALAIAVALWFVANIEHDVEKSVAINVNYENLPSDMIIVNKPPDRLTIRIRGPRNKLESLSTRNMPFTVDLTSVSPGPSRFEIQTDQIKTPRGVQVTGITPAEIKLEIEKLMVKEVGIRPVIEGPADTGFEAAAPPRVEPSKVEIRGPRSIVSRTDVLYTDSVSIAGVRSKFTIQVPLKSPNPLVEIVKNEVVRVTVDIQEQRVEKQFNDLDIELVNFNNHDYEALIPLKVDLAFEGPYSVIRDLNSDDITAFIDGKDLKKDQNNLARLEVDVKYPHEEIITLKKKEPKLVEIRLN